MTDGYEWQHEVYPKWRDMGYTGVVKGVTGSGKTVAGCIALSQYLADHPNSTVLIVTPRQEINRQWEQELERFGINATVYGYYKAVSQYAQGKLPPVDVVIADECHALLTPQQGRVLDYHSGAILGLSATPDGAEELLGGVIAPPLLT